jgi:predicted site-specific integrase-resolvase
MPSQTAPDNSKYKPVAVSETPWDTNGFMSVSQASNLAKVSDETIRAWYDSGEIVGFRDARGHRIIDAGSLLRRISSLGVVEAARHIDRSPYIVRRWFDQGRVEGYLTATGRRRVFRSSIEEYVRSLAEPPAAEPTT